MTHNDSCNARTVPVPGWGIGGDFSDPRPDRLGPMPADRGKYRGLYMHGDKVIFSYTIGDCPVLDMFYAEDRVIVRVIEMGPSKRPLTLRLAERASKEARARCAC